MCVTDTRSPQVNYRLTDKGTSLFRAVQALLEWAHDWINVTPQTASDG